MSSTRSPCAFLARSVARRAIFRVRASCASGPPKAHAFGWSSSRKCMLSIGIKWWLFSFVFSRRQRNVRVQPTDRISILYGHTNRRSTRFIQDILATKFSKKEIKKTTHLNHSTCSFQLHCIIEIKRSCEGYQLKPETRNNPTSKNKPSQFKMKSNHYNIVPSIILGYIIFTLLAVDFGEACGPGRSNARRVRRRRYPPLVQRQYLPNVSENTLGASGRPEGPIRRHDKRFKELVQNWNPDIEFRDDERTGADRMMTQVSFV